MDNNNPWLSITDGNVKIATCDIPFFESEGSAELYAEKINKKCEVELTFDCMPEPFCGNPDSKVYCLNNLQLKSDKCFWAEDIRNKCGKLHDGVDWMRKRTKSLKDFLDDYYPDIFFIEYFPYHSTKGFAFPKHLPSYGFSDELIKRAKEEKKLIILMREKTNWIKRLKKSIPDIEQYEKLYKLKCPQGGYLTRDNIVRYCDDGNDFKLSDEEIRYYFKK